MMSEQRFLRGGCHCGRNRYSIVVPPGSICDAQVLFNTESAHQIPLATPLAAYLRVPLAWYHSTTSAFFPDETPAMIRRVYTHYSEQASKRGFCGFCGTPLSYWSEDPMSEANYISLTLGSLVREDIRDLEDLGLIPDESDVEEPEAALVPRERPLLRESFGVPWFDGLVEETRLGRMRRSQGVQWSRDGNVKVEWEVVEFSDGGDEDVAHRAVQDMEMEETTGSSAKRKLHDREKESGRAVV